MLSDVSGLSSSSSGDDIANQTSNSTPRNSTDVCRSVPACLTDKSLNMEAPERQHLRKRAPADKHGPSDTSKRRKVNGNTLDSRPKDESKQLTQVGSFPSTFFLMQL